MMHLAMDTRAALRAAGHSKLCTQQTKHEKKVDEAKKKNLEIESAVTGLKNHHHMKMHLPYTVTLPGKADVQWSMKGITGK